MITVRELTRTLEELTSAGGPISFYDGIVVVREARQVRVLEDRVLSALIALHDLPQSTDGLREVLGEFLSTCAKTMAEERQRAGREITLTDNGCVARAIARDPLLLALEEKSGAGFEWEIEKASAGIRVERLARDPDRRTTALFRVTPRAAGRGRLALVEQPPPSDTTELRREALRRFTLELVIEGR